MHGLDWNLATRGQQVKRDHRDLHLEDPSRSLSSTKVYWQPKENTDSSSRIFPVVVQSLLSDNVTSQWKHHGFPRNNTHWQTWLLAAPPQPQTTQWTCQEYPFLNTPCCLDWHLCAHTTINRGCVVALSYAAIRRVDHLCHHKHHNSRLGCLSPTHKDYGNLGAGAKQHQQHKHNYMCHLYHH